MEGLKLEAYKEAKKEQDENASKLWGKVKGVEKTRGELQKADSAAREALGKVKFTKAQMAKLEEEFEKMLEDEAVRKYLEKKNIRTMEEYIAAEDIEKTQLVKSYESLSASLASLKTEFEAKVWVRAGVNQNLKKELDQNDPSKPYEELGNPPRSIYDRFSKAALEQSKNIEDNEISALVDEVLTGRKEIIEDYVQKYIANPRDPETAKILLVTKEDIMKLQKYGSNSDYSYSGYFNKGLDLFKEKMKVMISEISPEHKRHVQEIFDSHLSRALRVVSAENNEVGKAIQNETNSKRLEAIKPELEAIFSELENKINQSPFRHLVKGLASAGEYGVVVGFNVDVTKASLFGLPTNRREEVTEADLFEIKYFSLKQSGTQPLTSLGRNGLERMLVEVKADLSKAEEERAKRFKSERSFAGRFWLSRILNKEEGIAISRRLAKSRSDVSNLQKVKELQEGLLAFMGKLNDLEEKNDYRLDIRPRGNNQGTIDLRDFKTEYIQGLEKRFELKR